MRQHPYQHNLEADDMASEEQPVHGEERERCMRRDNGASVEHTTSGGATFSIPVVSREYTYVERYCTTCKDWIPCDGIVWHMLCKVCKTSW
jgi:hypothetical protein